MLIVVSQTEEGRRRLAEFYMLVVGKVLGRILHENEILDWTKYSLPHCPHRTVKHGILQEGF